jgi:hypothetical protein
VRGLLRDNPDTRAEFFRLLQGMKDAAQEARHARAKSPGEA